MICEDVIAEIVIIILRKNLFDAHVAIQVLEEILGLTEEKNQI